MPNCVKNNVSLVEDRTLVQASRLRFVFAISLTDRETSISKIDRNLCILV